MKIGYPVINYGLGCIGSHTFRLAALTDQKLIETVRQNLACIRRMLEWNVAERLLFYRISSNIIPFASHPAMRTDWQTQFRAEFREVGEYIRRHSLRISMHPGQYIVLNSPSEATVRSSVAELVYHTEVMDLLELDQSHKVQIHLGGLHGDAVTSRQTFIKRYRELPAAVRRRLVIENDERTASTADCYEMSQSCGIPVLFDTLHHQVNNAGETTLKALDLAMSTWRPEDGVPMIDYSNQNPDKKTGAHALTLDVDKFRSFIKSLRGRDIDIMFEIKNKEASALQARLVIESMGGAVTAPPAA